MLRIPAWTATSYATDRRTHRHRCKCCNRVIALGDAAFVARISAKKTIAVHEACADQVVVPGRAGTYRDTLREAAFQYELACRGYSETNHRHYEKIAKMRADAGVPSDR